MQITMYLWAGGMKTKHDVRNYMIIDLLSTYILLIPKQHILYFSAQNCAPQG